MNIPFAALQGGTPMDCNECRKRLIDYIESLLPADESSQVTGHIEQCTQCRNELLRLRHTLTIMEHDSIPLLGPAKRQALYPLVMERVAQKTYRIRRRNRLVYSFGSALAIICIFIVSIIGFRSQRQTDYYALFFDPQHVIYSDDPEINSYVLETLIGDDALLAEVHDVARDAWIDNSKLTSLVDELSEEEIGTLMKKLETIELNGG